MATLKSMPAAEAVTKLRQTERRTDLKVALENFFGEFLPENGFSLPLTSVVYTDVDEDGNLLGIGWSDFPEYIRAAVNKREKNAGIQAISGAINRAADTQTYLGTWAIFVADKDEDSKISGSIVLFPNKAAARKSGHAIVEPATEADEDGDSDDENESQDSE